MSIFLELEAIADPEWDPTQRKPETCVFLRRARNKTSFFLLFYERKQWTLNHTGVGLIRIKDRINMFLYNRKPKELG